MPEEVKDSRLQRLQELLGRQQTAFNRRWSARVMPVLFEQPGRHPGQLIGRSPYLQAVHRTAESCVGTMAEVEIARAGANSLAGEMLEASAA